MICNYAASSGCLGCLSRVELYRIPSSLLIPYGGSFYTTVMGPMPGTIVCYRAFRDIFIRANNLAFLCIIIVCIFLKLIHVYHCFVGCRVHVMTGILCIVQC